MGVAQVFGGRAVDRASTVPTDDEATDFAADFASAVPSAYRLVRALGCSPDDAADVIQDAVMNAWRYRAGRRGSFAPWFLGIVYRQARRSPRRWLTIPARWRGSGGPASQLDFLELLRPLPRRQRAAVWLRFGLDWTYVDVGRSLGISEAAAKQLVVRAKETLRAHLQVAMEANHE